MSHPHLTLILARPHSGHGARAGKPVRLYPHAQCPARRHSARIVLAATAAAIAADGMANIHSGIMSSKCVGLLRNLGDHCKGPKLGSLGPESVMNDHPACFGSLGPGAQPYHTASSLIPTLRHSRAVACVAQNPRKRLATKRVDDATSTITAATKMARLTRRSGVMLERTTEHSPLPDRREEGIHFTRSASIV